MGVGPLEHQEQNQIISQTLPVVPRNSGIYSRCSSYEPQAKFLKKQKYPLWELRPMPERFFYGTWQKNKFIILNHYTKKTNETDPKQLNKAIKLLEDWYERNGK